RSSTYTDRDCASAVAAARGRLRRSKSAVRIAKTFLVALPIACVHNDVCLTVVVQRRAACGASAARAGSARPHAESPASVPELRSTFQEVRYCDVVHHGAMILQ